MKDLRTNYLRKLCALPKPKTVDGQRAIIEATAFHLATIYIATEKIPFSTELILRLTNAIVDTLAQEATAK